MAYRSTEKTRQRAAAKRTALVHAARDLVAASGFAGTKVVGITRACGVSTGSFYSYFDNRDELLAEVFREAAAWELRRVSETLEQGPADPLSRLEVLIHSFASRALASRQMAWSLLFEPVSPEVEAERLVYRKAYTDLGEAIIREGIATSVFVSADPGLAASATMGAVTEALIGRLRPLPTGDPSPDDATGVITAITSYCFRALGAAPPDQTRETR